MHCLARVRYEERRGEYASKMRTGMLSISTCDWTCALSAPTTVRILVFSALPQTLILTLKRFETTQEFVIDQWTGQENLVTNSKKLFDAVNFPKDGLHMRPMDKNEPYYYEWEIRALTRDIRLVWQRIRQAS